MSDWAYSMVAVITAAGTTTYVVSGLSPGTTYNWEVQENYETCLLVLCTPESVTTDPLNLTQPSVAYLNVTGVTSTSATLEWTDNATYGTLVSFLGYTVWEELNGGAATEVTSVSTEAQTSYVATLASGESYSFFINTADCIAGCGGGAPTSSVTQSNLITLGTPLTLTVTVFADRTTIDLGQSDYFTCTPTGGESPFAYAWNFGNGTYVAGNATESVALAGLGVLTVTCQITDHEPEVKAGSADVLVNQPLVVTVTMNRASADVGQAIEFNCTVANGTAPYSLTWAFGDGTTSIQNMTTHSYSSVGDYAPTCVVYDSAGVGKAASLAIVIGPDPPRPSPFSWFTAWDALAIAGVVAVIVAIALIARRRREAARDLVAKAPPYVPPTDPTQTIYGAKICAFCGGSNLPLRTTCRACGKPLPPKGAT
jgi:hypothetical protein